ncbi:transcription factor WRKY19-like [Lolium rigidum]|uniref:transcription factor WRKY19-like n=1 Tax=Lolium rigidum TaxID=89674 RepID=UPI001F5CEFE1|nr:transcription factor WRKY19-like [Lolium rigidum]
MEKMVNGNGGGSRLVVTELSHIKELVKQLEVHLGGSPDLCKDLAAQIFTVTEKSISMIRSGNFDFDGRKSSANGAGLHSPPLSATPSPLSGVSDMPFKTNKKRKTDKGRRQVRVSSAGEGADAPEDDGFSWRKYGQKDILGAHHPRAYYRCTHQKTQGCTATKQVQRVDEDPTLYDVIYNGDHTCVHKATAAATAKAQPEDKSSLLQSLSSSLKVETEGLTPRAQQGWGATTPFSFSSPAVSGLTPSTPENSFWQGVSAPTSLEPSPATSGSNYLSMRAQCELDTMVSALTTATSMPPPAMPTLEDTTFSLDGIDADFDISDVDFDISCFFATDC